MNKSKKFFKAIRNDQGKLSWNNKVIEPLGESKIKIDNKEFNLTPEIQKAMTMTNYNFRNMSDDDILNFANILQTVDYNPRLDSHILLDQNTLKNNLKNRIDKILHPIPLSLPASEIEESSMI